ncbi:MAG TPA: 3-phosphoserine/phosphohydroxythreonine transaminase [Herpetosiphonaceae bacterium]|nr:3-phosphoserine/phosphohydroxythreonine transaminase [Herpetosiphonaceae bacterium]
MHQVYNFNAGPAIIPRSVLEQVQRELLDYAGRGISIMEMSHRAKEFMAIVAEAEALLKELMQIPAGYRVLFLQGGASTQFAMVPMNFLPPGTTADFVLTGTWSEKALEDAAKIGQTHVAASTQTEQYRRVPRMDEITLSDAPVYVHLTSNNTIYGTQWRTLPVFGAVPLVADMSSDMLSRPVDVAPYGLIYAGAQKNLGPAGVTVVIIREEWLQRVPKHLPAMLRYDIHAKNNSLYNTPPTFPIYVTCLVLRWIQQMGGVEAMDQRNQAKAALVYDAIDTSGGFYRGHAAPDSRSLMNITFRLPSEEQEKAFARAAAEQGFVGLEGHRSVGGIRASTYNALPPEGCTALAQFMREFLRTQG